MANASDSSLPPVTEEAFLADRQHFLASFISFSTGSVIFLVVLMILLAIFLV